MATRPLNDFGVLNFSGGIHRSDKSEFENETNELRDALNIEIDNRGRLRKRRGSVQFGNTLAGTIGSSHSFALTISGNSQPTRHFIFAREDAGNTDINRFFGTRLTANVAVGDATINVGDTTNFDASGTIEIEGDLITYSAKGAGTFTVSGGTITSAHSSGAAVHQIDSIDSTNFAGQQGVYYAILNNLLVINARTSIYTWDGTTMSSATTPPNGLFLTNYKDRVYVAGSGISGTNSSPIRVSYSDRGDPANWNADGFFDVEDQYGEIITGLKDYKENLLIFKANSTFGYNLSSLTQLDYKVGAYNHRVVEEINGFLYTFCALGIWEGTGGQWRLISEPVKEYIDNFVPKYDTSQARVINNTFAGSFDGKYFLYIGNITQPETRNDVVLVFDTKTRSWSTYDGFTNLSHFGSFKSVPYGTGTVQGTGNYTTQKDFLVWGNTSGQLFRMFSTRHLNSNATIVGGDVFQDRISNTGSAVSAKFETPMYDMNSPHIIKSFGFLQALAEKGRWQIDWRVEDRKGISDYKSLGFAEKINNYLPLPREAKGYRIGFRVTENSSVNAPVFNGFIISDIKTDTIK